MVRMAQITHKYWNGEFWKPKTSQDLNKQKGKGLILQLQVQWGVVGKSWETRTTALERTSCDPLFAFLR